MAISVAVAVGDTGDRLIEKLEPKVRGMKVAPGTDPEADMGPFGDEAAPWTRSRAMSTWASRKAPGWWSTAATCVLQGYENGFFLGGCLFDEVTPDMRIYKEEIFGPVLSVVRVPDFSSALQLVNRPLYEYGKRHLDLHRGRRRRREPSRRTATSAWSGSTCRSPVPMAFHSFGGVEAQRVRRPPASTAWRGVRFFPPS